MKRERQYQDETSTFADSSRTTPILTEQNQNQHQIGGQQQGQQQQQQQKEPPTKQKSHPTKKRKLQFGQSSNLHGVQNTRIFEHFRPLDPTNPVEAKRMNTRYKQISKGKNTVGYDTYIKQIPKQKRKKIVEHPSTPDYKADIPNRRWLGLVKAWRISLHKYDPKELKSDLCSDSKLESCDANGNANNTNKKNEKVSLQPKPLNVKDQQIAHASSQGLQVDFADANIEVNMNMSTNMNMNVNMNVNKNSPENDTSTQSQNQLSAVKSDDTEEHKIVSPDDSHDINDNDNTNNDVDDVNDELDAWESNRNSIGQEDELLLDYDDSDDDLL